ncbi:MAG: hypothetical protein GTO02_08240, partial [Candidatus Dadabacteria bacterium]|nr:hypothetical protein [Candidatus Dadabacteria bacterium]NIQ14378.1 hypothetical protein [Candidatus Dadabacteria bacterium]
MNILDLILLSILLVLFIIGLLRGLIKQLFSIIALVGAIVLGILFYNVASIYLLKYNIIADKSVATVVGFISIALVYYILIQIIAWLLTKLIGKLKLTWANRLGGGLLGILFGVILSHFVVLGSLLYIDEKDPIIKESIVAPYIE